MFYTCSFGLKYYTIVQVAIYKAKISRQDFWNKVETLRADDTDSLKDVYDTFYWLNDGKWLNTIKFQEIFL
jgi:hypothetical protein